ncbi:MAG: hypothetical protein ACTSX6_01805 [Candidatus Heimdallarchaeaceae archaeon]
MRKRAILKRLNIKVLVLLIIFVFELLFSAGIMTLLGLNDTSPPSISNIKRENDLFVANQPNVITCEIKDENLISKALLHYSIDGNNYSTLMKTYEYNIYSGTIPGTKIGSTIYYFVEAIDQFNNTAKSNTFGPFESYDGIKPVIGNIYQTPESVFENNVTTVHATVTDNV